MVDTWKADRHAHGWAVYRRGAGAREVYRLPADRDPMIFDQQRAAAVWAEILNERADARR